MPATNACLPHTPVATLISNISNINIYYFFT